MRLVLHLGVVVALVLAGGCDLFRDLDSTGDPSRVPAGGPERIRFLVPARPLGVFELVPYELHRVAHEGDDTSYHPARVRCARLSLVGQGLFVSSAGADGGLATAREVRFDVDRGQSHPGLMTSTRAGSVVVRAELLGGTCATRSSSVLADVQRILQFVQTGDFTLPGFDGGPP